MPEQKAKLRNWHRFLEGAVMHEVLLVRTASVADKVRAGSRESVAIDPGQIQHGYAAGTGRRQA